MWTLFSKTSSDQASLDESSMGSSPDETSLCSETSLSEDVSSTLSSHKSSNESVSEESLSVMGYQSSSETEDSTESSEIESSEIDEHVIESPEDISDAESSGTPLSHILKPRLDPPPAPKKIALRDPGPSQIQTPQDYVSLIVVSVVSDGEFPENYVVMGDPDTLETSKDAWNGVIEDPRTIPDELADLYTLIPGLSAYTPRRVRLGKRRRVAPLQLWMPIKRPRSVKNIYTLYIDCCK